MYHFKLKQKHHQYQQEYYVVINSQTAKEKSQNSISLTFMKFSFYD